MRFSIQLPTDRVDAIEEFCQLQAITEMASCVEQHGFDACYVTEHPFPSDDWLNAGGHHAMDPFVSLSAAACASKRLKLHTNILVLPYRNPFLTAKAIASLDVLSNGRVIMGAAAGYMVREYKALGADFENRNARIDEALAAIKLAWQGNSVKMEGENFEVRGNTMLPRPLQLPHPPIWIGGNSKLAIRRVVEAASGWSPFPLPAQAGKRHAGTIDSIEDLRAKIDYMHDYAKQLGRTDPIDICFAPFNHGMNSDIPLLADEFLEQVSALQAIGVNYLAVGFKAKSRAHYCDWVENFGKEIIAKVTSE